MSSDQKVPGAIPAAGEVEPPLKKRAVTLYAIIIFKLIKGLLCVALALVIYNEADNNIPEDYQNFLQNRLVKTVFKDLRIHPESKFFTHLAEQFGTLTEAKVKWAALGVLLLSLFPLVEGIGMLFRVGWAGWLAIGETAFFIPIEFYEMLKQVLARPDKFPWSIFVVTIINIIIVWYLYDNRQVLFHHHHRRHPGGS
jgi:uncharacterized membrane protein (DUF2068 family)